MFLMHACCWAVAPKGLLVGRAYALGVPEPVLVEVVVVRRGPASPTLFINGLDGADAQACESAEAALLAALVAYGPLHKKKFAYGQESLEACPDLWAAAQHLSFKVRHLSTRRPPQCRIWLAGIEGS